MTIMSNGKDVNSKLAILLIQDMVSDVTLTQASSALLQKSLFWK